MPKRDFYEVLGIDRNASERDIKKAYKRLAIKFHPDRNPGDEKAADKFKEAKEAYEVLIDSQKRSAYDQHGHTAFEQSGSTSDFGDVFGDIFGDIFGGGGRRSGQARGQRGSDLRYNMDLSLEDAVRGCSREIEIPTLVRCDPCHGSGSKGGRTEACSVCQGHGQVQMRQGFFSVQQTCPTCYGSGRVVKDPCNACHGKGRRKKTKTLSVKIPAGVDAGDRIRLNGEGESGEMGAPSGDLYVQVQIKKHHIFERDGNNLYCEVPVSFAMAAVGGEVEVPALDGRISLKVPAETQTGRLFRMRGKGVRGIRGGITGDLLVKLVVETPIKLSVRQKELLKELEDSCGGEAASKHKPKAEGFFSGVKQFFDELTR